MTGGSRPRNRLPRRPLRPAGRTRGRGCGSTGHRSRTPDRPAFRPCRRGGRGRPGGRDGRTCDPDRVARGRSSRGRRYARTPRDRDRRVGLTNAGAARHPCRGHPEHAAGRRASCPTRAAFGGGGGRVRSDGARPAPGTGGRGGHRRFGSAARGKDGRARGSRCGGGDGGASGGDATDGRGCDRGPRSGAPGSRRNDHRGGSRRRRASGVAVATRRGCGASVAGWVSGGSGRWVVGAACGSCCGRGRGRGPASVVRGDGGS